MSTKKQKKASKKTQKKAATKKVAKAKKPVKKATKVEAKKSLKKPTTKVKATAKKVAETKKPSKSLGQKPKVKTTRPTLNAKTKKALQTEVQKKRVKESLPLVSTEKLEPGLLSKQQVKTVERMIQKGAEWELISSLLASNARTYKMSETFSEKSAIKHPVLGLGFVTAADNHKITVIFKDGTRNLVMNYKS